MPPDILRRLQFCIVAGIAGYCFPFALFALSGMLVPSGHLWGLSIGAALGLVASTRSTERYVKFLFYPTVVGLLFPLLIWLCVPGFHLEVATLPLEDWNTLYAFFVRLYTAVGFAGGLCVAYLYPSQPADA